jgi:hypothetical protein
MPSVTLQAPAKDNGCGISVPSTFQTPDGNIAANLASRGGLTIFEGDGTNSAEASRLVDEAVAHVREQRGPAMLRLAMATNTRRLFIGDREIAGSRLDRLSASRSRAAGHLSAVPPRHAAEMTRRLPGKPLNGFWP